jgi:hypothetical protein
MPSEWTRARLLRFVLGFALIFGLLIAPWPGWNGAYGSYFRGFGNWALSFGDDRRFVELAPAVADPRGLDTQIRLANRTLLDSEGRGKIVHTDIDSRAIGWLPTALTLALIGATPISWRRRAWALLGGLVLIHVFLAFTLLTWVWNNAASVSLSDPSPWMKQVLDELNYTLMTQIGASFTVPVIIWVLVTFRRQDAPAEGS